ncbi:MAG: hypothetical protein V3W41_13085 [Planctomycetota bacterium]
MNYRFKKKPVTIEAFQMTEERRRVNEDWPPWLHDAWQKDRKEPGALFPVELGSISCPLAIHTLEGEHAVDRDDWIIQGVKGELYPCKPDIFALTYDPAPD